MNLPDKPTSYADLLAGEAAEDEQINILKKRLLIPLVVFAVLLGAWVAWRHMPGGPRIAQAPHAVVRF
ncbi:MAG: hypothetical protein JSR66_10540 [Proteobacteria bacterium]|nr:hypothetical protein [Pseudomonadota bacterium]